MENVCHAVERAGAASTENPAERAHRTSKWIEAHTRTDTVKRGLAALAGATPKTKAKILRLMAQENGYTGPCPIADELDRLANQPPPPPSAPAAPPAPETPAAAHQRKMRALYTVGEQGRAAELRASPHPIRSASEELTVHGKRLYGRPLPVFIGYTSDAKALAEQLATIGCRHLPKGFRPYDKRARQLLEKCKPYGPALLERHAVAAEASVGRATLALLIESLATAEMKKSPVHEALVAALLGPARPLAQKR